MQAYRSIFKTRLHYTIILFMIALKPFFSLPSSKARSANN